MHLTRLLPRLVLLLAVLSPAAALSALTVKPITWEVLGLDSNKPAVSGPDQFPFGARVCTDGAAAGPVEVEMALGSGTGDPYISLGGLTTVSIPAIPDSTTNNGSGPGCADAYFTVDVVRNTAAYTRSRPFTFAVKDTGGATLATFPASGTRQLYVEYLVSQNRNSISSVTLNNNPPTLSGGVINVSVGQQYTLKLTGKTATNGYEQLEAFLNLPNSLFRVEKVETTYSADSSAIVASPNDKLYGDGCGWENDPASVNYKACLGTGKVGGNITVTYTLTVVGGAGTSRSLTALIYDFSGSSYHYNSDFGSFSITLNILDTPNVSLTKSFSPNAVSAQDKTRLTFTLSNNGNSSVSGVTFTDNFPTGGGNPMAVFNPPSVTASPVGCGGFSPVLAGGETSINFASAGSLAAGASCEISLDVKAPSANGTYDNQTNNIFINGVDTGVKSNVASLSVGQTAPPRIAKQFLTSPIAAGSTTTLRFTLFNDNTGTSLAGVGFTDTYPSVSGGSATLTNVGTVASQNTCAVQGTVTLGTAPQGVTVSGVTLNAAPAVGTPYSCVIDVPVSASVAGSYLNTTGVVSSTTPATTGGTASATLEVGNLTVAKSFSPASIALNGTSTLTITLNNATGVSLSGLSFTDTFPAGLEVADPSTVASSCGSASVTTSPQALILSGGGPLAAAASCTVSVLVRATTIPPNNEIVNSTGPISFTPAGGSPTTAGPATGKLTVNAAEPAIQLGKFVATSATGPWLPSIVVNVTPPNNPPAKVYYKFEVSNIGNVPLSNIQISDSNLPGVSASCFSGVTLAVPTVLEDPSSIASCVYPLSGLNASPGQVTNTATAQATGGGQQTTSAPDSATYFGVDRQLALVKEVSTSADGPWSQNLFVPAGTASVYYRFTAINNGNVELTGVTVSDAALPSASLTACNATLSPLAAGAARRCVLPAVPAASSGSVTNIASATASAGASPVASNDSSAVYTVSLSGAIADLRVVKDVTPVGAVSPGQTVSYTITVYNEGSSDVVDARLIDPPPTPSSNFTVQGSLGCSTAPSPLPAAECPAPAALNFADLQGTGIKIPSLPSGRSVAFTYSGTAGSSGTITNTAIVYPPPGTEDPDYSNNIDSAFTTITTETALADLEIVKSVTPAGVVDAGAALTYTLTVKNLGTSTSPVTNATVRDPQPVNVTFNTIACTSVSGGGSCGAGTLPIAIDKTNFLQSGFVIPSLPVGGSVVLTIQAIAGQRGDIFNNASVAAPEGGPLDPNPLNNYSSVYTPISILSIETDLEVVKTGPVSAGSNSTLTYDLEVTNKGLRTVANAVLFDAVAGPFTPAEAIGCSVVQGTATCPAAQNLTWLQLNGGLTLPSLGPGAKVKITVSGTTGSSGTIFNTAGIAPPSGIYDINPLNNSSSVSTIIVAAGPGADLKVTKTGPASASPNAGITYTIKVENLGAVAADGAMLRDPAVPNFTPVSVSCGATTGDAVCPSQPQVAELQGGIVIKKLGVGSSLTFTVNGITGASGSIVNVATVYPPPGIGDPISANNSSTATTSLGTAPPSGGSISGYVWYDTNGNNTRDPGEPPRAGWKVELEFGGEVRQTTVSKADGSYSFSGLIAGTYTVRFTAFPRSAVPGGPTGGPVNGDTSGNGGTPSGMWLLGINVPTNVAVVDQSLPIDPSGVVYDATARTPIAGATVTLLFNGLPADPSHVAGGSITDVSAAGGQYAFFLLPGAPTGTWGLSVAPTGPYNGTPSLLIQPSPAPAGFAGGSVGTVGVPPQGAVTTYYLAFPLPTIDLVNNNIPLDSGRRIPTLSAAWLALLSLMLALTAGRLISRQRRDS